MVKFFFAILFQLLLATPITERCVIIALLNMHVDGVIIKCLRKLMICIVASECYRCSCIYFKIDTFATTYYILVKG